MKKLKIAAILLLSLPPVSSFAVTPMEYYNSLVAGNDDPGYKDGAFDDSLFNQPAGLVFDQEGNRLFVADQKNHRIRVVKIYENQRVETLAGSGAAGNSDGTFAQATFEEPMGLAFLPDEQLVVYNHFDPTRRDPKKNLDNSLKLLNLKTRQVSTLVNKDLVQAWNIVYWPKDHSLYLSDPAQGVLQRYDMKSKKLSIVLTRDSKVPQPKALCVYQGELYVSDAKSSSVYRVEPSYSGSDITSIHLRWLGQGDHLVALTATDDCVYGLQACESPLALILPDTKPVPRYTAVELPTMWGFWMNSKSSSYIPFLKPSNERPSGFAASPREPRKFYITRRSDINNSIVSVKDYHFKEWWGSRSRSAVSNALSDFDYPEAKPPKTFRILIAGNSMVTTSPRTFGEKVEAMEENDSFFGKLMSWFYSPPPISEDPAFHDGSSFRTDTMSKQLEVLLNTQSSLKGLSRHFEVLNIGHPGGSVIFYSNREIPALVKKYDIDMVIAFVTPYPEEEFTYYYSQPLTPEGIPSGAVDPEFMLKPIAERMPVGTPAADLFERAKTRKIATITSSNQVLFNCSFQGLLATQDAGIRNDLIAMFSKPLKLLGEKLTALKTLEGKPVRLMVCFTPNDGGTPLSAYESFWTTVCAQSKVNLLDLSKPFDDMKVQYFPVMEACCGQHFMAYGNGLIAYLMSYYLPAQNWIPFK
ncbi:MAG TPA: hypothetical protein VK791_07455 [bacterium]|nr:hypothetical protein [bacterium]